MQKEAKIIMVTGGAGYIGSALTEALLEKGYQVKVLDRLFFGLDPVVNCLLNPKFEVIKEDIRSAAPNLFEGVDSVLHLAAISNDPACELDPDVTIGINYKGGNANGASCQECRRKAFCFCIFL